MLDSNTADHYVEDNDIQAAAEMSIDRALRESRYMGVPRQIIAGVDIGGTKTAIVLSSHLPQVLARAAFATRPDLGPDPAIQEIIRSLYDCLAQQNLKPSDMAAIGISCGGPLDAASGLIQAPPNLSTWQDVQICQLLRSAFGVPCYLENDANAGALAESRFGAGRGTRNFVFLTMGTGFGAGPDSQWCDLSRGFVPRWRDRSCPADPQWTTRIRQAWLGGRLGEWRRHGSIGGDASE